MARRILEIDEVTRSKDVSGNVYDGGWPLESHNPHAKDLDIARKLVKKSYELVGMK